MNFCKGILADTESAVLIGKQISCEVDKAEHVTRLNFMHRRGVHADTHPVEPVV